jgi:Concanavalin A-like lectin/glucanases superfamily
VGEAWVGQHLGLPSDRVKADGFVDAGVQLGQPVGVAAGGQCGDVASTKTIADTSSWHYVAATKSGSSVHLYIDGADVTGAVANRTLSNNTLPLVIGQSSGGSFFKGQIQEVALYNQVLTADQTADDYHLGVAPCSPKSSTYSQGIKGTAGNVSYWRLGESPGVAVACDSGGTNPGSYTGGVTLG